MFQFLLEFHFCSVSWIWSDGYCNLRFFITSSDDGSLLIGCVSAWVLAWMSAWWWVVNLPQPAVSVGTMTTGLLHSTQHFHVCSGVHSVGQVYPECLASNISAVLINIERLWEEREGGKKGGRERLYEAMRYKKLDEGDGWRMKKALYRPPGTLALPCCSSPSTLKATKWAALTKKEHEVTVKRCVSAQDRVSVICGIILQRCLDRKSFSILGTLNGRIMNNE